MHQVVIIGAGLTGLFIARQLQALDIDFVVLEARDRIGGRILSVDANGTPATDGLDLGPSWFWPHAQPAMAKLVAELGLPCFPQYGDGDVLFERMLREGPQRFQGHPQEPRSYRLAGGSAALARALLAPLPVNSVRLRHTVTALALQADHVQITARHGDADVHLSSRVVITAVPPRLLAHLTSFAPSIPSSDVRRWRDTPTWMAPHAKFFAVYDRPFWREAGLSGSAQSMVGPMPEVHDATTASGLAALFGFIGVPAAQRRAMGEDAITHACVDQLVRLFGSEAATPRATLVKDWAADALTATADDQTPGGRPVALPTPWISGSWSQRLIVSGSETSPTEPGYLAGAVTAALEAVRTVRTRL